MYCKNCGITVNETLDSCPKCQTALDKTSITKTFSDQKPIVKEFNKVNGCAKLGFVFGMLSLIFCWTCFISLEFAFAGIVLSIIGLCTKNNRPVNAKKAKAGLIMSIIGYVISFIIYIAITLLVTFILAEKGVINYTF